jgi:hypothetical protein
LLLLLEQQLLVLLSQLGLLHHRILHVGPGHLGVTALPHQAEHRCLLCHPLT